MYGKFDEEYNRFHEQLILKLPGNSPGRNVAFKEGIKNTLVKSVENKNKIVEALGLGEDLRLKFDTMNPKLIEAHPSYSILRAGYADLGLPHQDEKGRSFTEMIIENMACTKGRDQRLSRLIMPSLVQRRPTTDWQKHFSTLGEVVSQQKREAFVSVNPLDIMFSTENAGYTSCYRLQGPHGAGNLAYAYDNFTAMTYIMGANEQKIARAFLYFNNTNYKDFILGKVYGQDGDATSKLLTSCLIEKLGAPEGKLTFVEDLPASCINVAASHHNPDHRKYAVFFDKIISARFTSKGSNTSWAMNFVQGICLTCGIATPANREHTHACEYCEAKFKPSRCSHCGHTSMNPEEFTSLPDHPAGSKQCNPCFVRNYVKCISCEAMARNGNLHEGHCGACVGRLYVQDFKGNRILRTEAKQAYDIGGRQKWYKPLKNGNKPVGMFDTFDEAKKMMEAKRAEKKAFLKDSADQLGKIQFEFEQAVTGKYKPGGNPGVYAATLNELTALDQ